MMTVEEKRLAVKRKLAQEKLSREAKPTPAVMQVDTPPVVEDRGFVDMVTGRDRTTETIESVPEIGAAPELNEFSLRALKSSFGLLSTGDDSELRSILKKQYGDQVDFSMDEKGNTVVSLPSGEYALNKPGLSAQDVARAVFDIAAFLPSSKAATIPAAAAKMAGTEAAIESGSAAVGGEFDGGEVAVAGAMGGLFKGAENLIGAGYRALKGSAKSPVVEAGKSLDIPVYTSDVTKQTFPSRILTTTGEKIPLFGTAGKRATQQLSREARVTDLANRYGNFSYESIVKSLKDQKDKVLKAAGNALERSGSKLDDIGEIPLDKTFNSIDDAVAQLNKPGVIKSSQAIDDVDTLLGALKEAPQTFTTLKENRTALRDIIESSDPAVKSQMGTRAKGLLNKIYKGMSDDMDNFAKANLNPKEYRQWKNANAVYSQEAKKMTSTRLKNVLDKGDVTPESVQTVLFSQKPSEVKNLYLSLTNEGRQNARAAFIDRIITNTARRAGGVSPTAVGNELKKYPAQVNILFRGEDKKALNGLIDVLSATGRAQEAGVVTPTGQTLWGLLGAGGLYADAGATIGGGATIGSLSRLYESAPVRDTLIRLASVPKGSTRYEKLLSEAVRALQVSGQAFREQAQEVDMTREAEK